MILEGIILFLLLLILLFAWLAYFERKAVTRYFVQHSNGAKSPEMYYMEAIEYMEENGGKLKRRRRDPDKLKSYEHR